MLLGDIEMPLHIEFVNLNMEQLDEFEDLISTLEDLEEELDGFTFSYFLEQFTDEEDWPDWRRPRRLLHHLLGD